MCNNASHPFYITCCSSKKHVTNINSGKDMTSWNHHILRESHVFFQNKAGWFREQDIYRSVPVSSFCIKLCCFSLRNLIMWAFSRTMRWSSSNYQCLSSETVIQLASCMTTTWCKNTHTQCLAIIITDISSVELISYDIFFI